MKGLIILIAVAVVSVVGGYILLNRSSLPPSSPAKTSTPPTKDSSRYIDYSSGVIERAQGTRRVLFFYASWCPICRPADESFKQNVNKIPEDVVLVRVNYNDPDTDSEEKALARKYAVTYQHTFVQIDQSGNEVTRWVGGQIDELLSRLL